MSLSAISRKTASLSLTTPRPQTDPTPATITSLPSSSLPIPTYNLTRTLGGVQTDLLIQSYEDRVFVMITQLGRMGFLTQATLSPLLPLLNPTQAPPSTTTSQSTTSTLTQILPMLPPPHPSILLTPLLGTPRDPEDQTRDELYISQVATLVWWLAENPSLSGGGGGGTGGGARRGGRRPVAVSLALAKLDQPVHPTRSEAGHKEAEKEEEEETAESDRERERFAGIMGMIAEWSGE